MIEFFYRRRGGYNIRVCIKIMLSGFQEITLELEKAYTFSLLERELFKFSGGMCNKMIKITTWKTKFVSSGSHI